jgi:3-dehydroquinate dehydratase II
MTRILVLNGPNLNLLGTREPEVYGHQTIDELHHMVERHALDLGVDIVFFQSNHEGQLIDRLHEKDFDGAVVNGAGLTHTSVSLRDALLAVARPFVEVHLSDPSKREAFRRVNFLADIAVGSVVGKGPAGYLEALDLIVGHVGAEA